MIKETKKIQNIMAYGYTSMFISHFTSILIAFLNDKTFPKCGLLLKVRILLQKVSEQTSFLKE